MEPVIYAGCTNNVKAQSTGRSGVQNCWRSCNAASSSEQMNKRLGVAQTPELLDDDALASPASLSPACSERSPHCLSREAQTPIVHQERKGAIPKSERLVIFTQVSGIWWAWPASDRPTEVDWCFFSAGIMHALPRSAGEVSYITMQGRDVWHGTLPSSSVAPHEVHCGLGSALCSQGRIVKHWDRL